jgi:hypothetical protein
MTDEKLLLEEIYHCIRSHILVDLDKSIKSENIKSAEYTLNHILKKIDSLFRPNAKSVTLEPGDYIISNEGIEKI